MSISDNIKSLLEDNEYHALARRFPGATFDANQKSWRVQRFFGQQYANPHLEESLSRIISHIEAKNMGKRVPNNSTRNSKEQSDQNLIVLEDLAKELGVKMISKGDHQDDKGLSFVLPEQIKLVFPSEAHVMLFPRGLYCSYCNYYVLHTELGRLRTLDCPSCKKSRLQQPSWLFYCKKCCLQQEIVPPFKKVIDGPVFKCPDPGCNGHLLLKLEASLSSSKWICSETRLEKPLIYFCPRCSRWNEPRDPVSMQLVRTTQSYLRQLTLSAVYVNNNIQFSTSAVKPSWRLSGDRNRDIIMGFGIDDLQIIEDVESFEVVYGYSSYESDSSPVPFKYMSSDSRQFEYWGYTMRNIGNGLLILLNKDRIMEFAIKGMLRDCEAKDPIGFEQAKAFESKRRTGILQYEEIANYTINTLNDRNRIHQRERSSLFKLIHSMEHAMTYHASIVTGLEESSFTGKVLIRDCGILIYERDQVEAGGVKYIAQNLLSRWLNFSIRQVRDCRYECSDGCVKCLYMQDPLCHPLLPWEVETYTIPNSLLDRKLLYEYWNLQKAITTES